MHVETVEQADHPLTRMTSLITGGLVAGLAFIGGLAAGRLLYEWLFPDLLWLGRPLLGLLAAIGAAILGWLLWRRLVKTLAGRGAGDSRGNWPQAAWSALSPFLPLAINLAYLFDPAVNLARSRLLFFSGLWLAAVFLARLLLRPAAWRWLAYVLILAFLLPVYLATMGQTVGSADTFEFQVVVPRLGIVHPTGYPLYLLLAKPFTWLPFNDVAWRVNLATLVFGLLAICLLYTLIHRLTKRIVPALLAAIVFGLTPTFWSQSIQAEVYSLHALLVLAALLLMREIGDWVVGAGDKGLGDSEQRPAGSGRRVYRLTVLLAFVVGLGLTNHLTTIILLPAAVMAVFFAYRQGRYQGSALPRIRSMIVVLAAFLLPLLLYAYLPIRWSAVNGEAMGWQRFVDWVIGGRFQGALQLRAWLDDSARYSIVGRLIADEWPVVWGLPLVLTGLVAMFFRQWRYALLLAGTWLGYTFYALSYYVPDLAVFLIPAYLIMALFWAVGLVTILQLINRLLPAGGARFVHPLQVLAALVAIAPALFAAAGDTWSTVDSSADDGRSHWGKSVLELPIPAGAAILADSDKFPPLYYLQQAEGWRPDLDIVVLPDENAYRSELDTRLKNGQAVYLARFLPGLEGIYHLRSLGPLTEAGLDPVISPPDEATPLGVSFGPIELLGYQLAQESPFETGQTALALYWRTREPLDQVLHVYSRWAGETFAGPATGQHAAGNTYPTVAWRAGEVVSDFHAIPHPALVDSEQLKLQVALAPPFTPAGEMDWQTISTVKWPAADPDIAAEPLRAQLGPLNLDGVSLSGPAGQGAPRLVRLSGYASAPDSLLLGMAPAGSDPSAIHWTTVEPLPMPAGVAGDGEQKRLQWVGPLADSLPDGLPAGAYDVLVAYAGQKATCNWLARPAERCVIGQFDASDTAPLPPGSVNFEDKIALTAIELPDQTLTPGGELALTLNWLALTPLSEDYTVFVQVLDENDRIVGQVDAWPVQGTYPTGQWPAGEVVPDPYLVRLSDELPPGQYKLYVGWYLLENLRRLQVLDQAGTAVDDKVVVPGLSSPE